MMKKYDICGWTMEIYYTKKGVGMQLPSFGSLNSIDKGKDLLGTRFCWLLLRGQGI